MPVTKSVPPAAECQVSVGIAGSKGESCGDECRSDRRHGRRVLTNCSRRPLPRLSRPASLRDRVSKGEPERAMAC